VRGALAQVEAFEAASAALSGIPAACIGPTTAAAAQKAGLRVALTPEEYTVEGLVEALVQWREAQVER
jgi:uroporphyrinogen III methyltransferase/synthase